MLVEEAFCMTFYVQGWGLLMLSDTAELLPWFCSVKVFWWSVTQRVESKIPVSVWTRPQLQSRTMELIDHVTHELKYSCSSWRMRIKQFYQWQRRHSQMELCREKETWNVLLFSFLTYFSSFLPRFPFSFHISILVFLYLSSPLFHYPAKKIDSPTFYFLTLTLNTAELKVTSANVLFC